MRRKTCIGILGGLTRADEATTACPWRVPREVNSGAETGFPLFAKSGKWYNIGMEENLYWKVCEALDNEKRMELMRYLIADRNEFPCVGEIVEKFGLGLAATSAYLKKLLDVGLVSSKREERRVYYRAYATTEEGERTVLSLRAFFETEPSHERMLEVSRYIHALSHYRRHAIIRLLNENPGMEVEEIAIGPTCRGLLSSGFLRNSARRGSLI